MKDVDIKDRGFNERTRTETEREKELERHTDWNRGDIYRHWQITSDTVIENERY